jgi:hypothetical protein
MRRSIIFAELIPRAARHRYLYEHSSIWLAIGGRCISPLPGYLANRQKKALSRVFIFLAPMVNSEACAFGSVSYSAGLTALPKMHLMREVGGPKSIDGARQMAAIMPFRQISKCAKRQNHVSLVGSKRQCSVGPASADSA